MGGFKVGAGKLGVAVVSWCRRVGMDLSNETEICQVFGVRAWAGKAIPEWTGYTSAVEPARNQETS